MATITGLTADRMLEIEAASVVDGDVVGDDLILTRKDGSIINAGNVRGGPGPTGPMGQSLAVITAQQLLEVGQVGQWRAGRQLTPSDFTNMGLSAPLGLWNLNNANDSSGNGRHLTIKGAVTFVSGINGAAASAALFNGGPVMYWPYGGGADPFRIRTGTLSFWMRGARRTGGYDVFSKYTPTMADRAFLFEMNNGIMSLFLYDGVGAQTLNYDADLVDERWHMVSATIDGMEIKLYVDGVLNYVRRVNFSMNDNATGPINIGMSGANATLPGSSAYSGRVDEVFITNDILTEEQIRNLYCVKIPHGLGSVPAQVLPTISRRRRGAQLVAADFPAQPARLYNFANGALTDLGANNTPLTNPVAYGTRPGPDGRPAGSFIFDGTAGGLRSSDAGLPFGLGPRSMGAWFRSLTTASHQEIITFGNPDVSLLLTSGVIRHNSGADVLQPAGLVAADGQWHHAVAVENDAAEDGFKHKLYLDGELVAFSPGPLTSQTARGADGFRVGAWMSDGTLPFIGNISRVFVYAGALTPDQIRALYNKGSQDLARSPVMAADFIEAVTATDILANFDKLEGCDVLDLAVMA